MVIFHSYVKLPEGIIINFPQFSPVFISFLSLHGPRQVWSRRSASPTATLPRCVAPKLRPWSMAGGLRRIRWGGWWSYGTSPDFHGILMDFQRIDEDFSIFSSIWINFSASNGGFLRWFRRQKWMKAMESSPDPGDVQLALLQQSGASGPLAEVGGQDVFLGSFCRGSSVNQYGSKLLRWLR